MAKTVVLQDRFDRGMVRDLPVDQLPVGAYHDSVDMIPGLKSGITKRYPWTRHSATLGNTYCAALSYANFAAGSQIVAITDTGACKQVSVTASTVTARGTAQVPFMAPTFYREKVYIASDNGTTTVKSYDGSSNAAAAAGSPPAGMFATVWKDHLVLARTAANANRVWFSNGGDAGTWDTGVDGQWLDVSFAPTGILALNDMILVFSEGGIERIVGSIIPGVAGNDTEVKTVFNVGASDPASIATDGDYVVFANANGVYMTDGIARPVDLTKECGIKTYWRDSFSGVYGPTVNLTGGIYQGHYIVTSNTAGAVGKCLCFDIGGRRVWRFSNINAAMMASAQTTSDARSGDLFFGERDNPYVSRLGSMFFVEGYNFELSATADGNAAQYTPSVTTGYMRGLPGTKRWRRLHVGYTLEIPSGDANGDVEWWTTPLLEASNGSGGSAALAETTGTETVLPRARVLMGNTPPSDGLAVRITGDQIADDFRVFLLEAEVRPREQSR